MASDAHAFVMLLCLFSPAVPAGTSECPFMLVRVAALKQRSCRQASLRVGHSRTQQPPLPESRPIMMRRGGGRAAPRQRRETQRAVCENPRVRPYAGPQSNKPSHHQASSTRQRRVVRMPDHSPKNPAIIRPVVLWPGPVLVRRCPARGGHLGGPRESAAELGSQPQRLGPPASGRKKEALLQREASIVSFDELQ